MFKTGMASDRQERAGLKLENVGLFQVCQCLRGKSLKKIDYAFFTVLESGIYVFTLLKGYFFISECIFKILT